MGVNNTRVNDHYLFFKNILSKEKVADKVNMRPLWEYVRVTVYKEIRCLHVELVLAVTWRVKHLVDHCSIKLRGDGQEMKYEESGEVIGMGNMEFIESFLMINCSCPSQSIFYCTMTLLFFWNRTKWRSFRPFERLIDLSSFLFCEKKISLGSWLLPQLKFA